MADDEKGVNGVVVDEFAIFRIGGRDIKVGAMTLWDLEQSRQDIQSISAEMPWTQYAATVVRIIARKLQPETYEAMAEGLQKACSAREARDLATSFNELWRVSGLMGEVEAAIEEAPVTMEESSGTGTSIESPPNSP